MVRNKEIYLQALTFRRKGFTYTEISKICGVSKATLSNWFSNLDFSKQITTDNQTKTRRENSKRMQLLNKVRMREKASLFKLIKQNAVIEYGHYKKDPKFIAGLMLYLTNNSANKTSKIKFSTTNIQLQKIFLSFIGNYLGIPKTKIKFWLLLHNEHNLNSCLVKWSKDLGLNQSQIYKTQILNNSNSKTVLHYGVGNIIISDVAFKYKLDVWIKLLEKDLIR